MTVTCVAVETTTFLFGMCHCTVDSDVGMGNFLLVLEILHLCGHAHMRSHVFLGMDCSTDNLALFLTRYKKDVISTKSF